MSRVADQVMREGRLREVGESYLRDVLKERKPRDRRGVQQLVDEAEDRQAAFMQKLRTIGGPRPEAEKGWYANPTGSDMDAAIDEASGKPGATRRELEQAARKIWCGAGSEAKAAALLTRGVEKIKKVHMAPKRGVKWKTRATKETKGE